MNLNKKISVLIIISIVIASLSACKAAVSSENAISEEMITPEEIVPPENAVNAGIIASPEPVASPEPIEVPDPTTVEAQKSPSGMFEKDNLSFQYPTEWEDVTENDPMMLTSPDGQKTIFIELTPTESADGSSTKIEMGSLLEKEGTLTNFVKSDREINGNHFTVVSYVMLDIQKYRVQYFSVKQGIKYNMIITTIDKEDPMITDFENTVTIDELD